jgi:FtsH-binding integral membrane protein
MRNGETGTRELSLLEDQAFTEHFRFGDHAKLTIIGVLVGAAGWPVLARISSAPRWLYGWRTVLVSVALFSPDAWLLVRGQPLDAVVVLVAMRVAIAVTLYCGMVFVAPVRRISA